MPLVQTLNCRADQVDGVEPGAIVRVGTAGAVWRVRIRAQQDDLVAFTLDPVDPHDVPLREFIVELPLPFDEQRSMSFNPRPPFGI
jgi:hypothetical protein